MSEVPLYSTAEYVHPVFRLIWNFGLSNRPSGWLRAFRALTSRLIFLAGVKWSCLRVNKPSFLPFLGRFRKGGPHSGWALFLGPC